MHNNIPFTVIIQLLVRIVQTITDGLVSLKCTVGFQHVLIILSAPPQCSVQSVIRVCTQHTLPSSQVFSIVWPDKAAGQVLSAPLPMYSPRALSLITE